MCDHRKKAQCVDLRWLPVGRGRSGSTADYSCDSLAPGALFSHPEVLGICVRELCDIPGGNWGLGMGLGEDKISFRLDLVCLAAKSSLSSPEMAPARDRPLPDYGGEKGRCAGLTSTTSHPAPIYLRPRNGWVQILVCAEWGCVHYLPEPTSVARQPA